MNLITSALILGLSTGVYCIGFCMPVALSLTFYDENSSLNSRTLALLKFSFGRLIAYLTFGGSIGYLGKKLNDPVVQKITAVSFIVFAVLLIVYSFVKGFPRFRVCTVLQNRIPFSKFPVIFGLISGFHICPPFLLAISYVFEIGNMLNGILFFFIFFLSTSLYLIPLIFAGYFSKFENIRWIAQISGLLAGLLFFWFGLTHLLIAIS